MEFLNCIKNYKDDKFEIFILDCNYYCNCIFCSKCKTGSFSIMTLSDHLWGSNINQEILLENFQVYFNILIFFQTFDPEIKSVI